MLKSDKERVVAELTERLRDQATFKKCAQETISVARDNFGQAIATKVSDAWAAVGVGAAGMPGPAPGPVSGAGGDTGPGGGGGMIADRKPSAARRAYAARKSPPRKAGPRKPA